MRRANRLTTVAATAASTSSRGIPWLSLGVVLGVCLLLTPSLALATPLAVSGAVRAMNTLEQSWPTYAVLNPVATGGAGSYRWDFTSNPSNYFTIDSTYGTVKPNAPLAAGNYPITVRVTDGASATATLSVTVPVLTTGLVVISTDTLFDNYAGSSWFGSAYVLANGFSGGGGVSTWTVNDPSGNFDIEHDYNAFLFKNGVVPPAGDYPISISVTQAGVGTIGPFNYTMHIVHAQQITSINFAQNTVSTSEITGCVVGTASTTVWEPGYQWSIPSSGSDGGTFTILDPNTGVVTLAKTPAQGARTITIKVQDGLNSYSQNFTVNVVAGTTVPPGNMSMTVASNLDNYTSSGSVGTPAVSGIPGTKSWSFTGGGVGNRYAINASTGQVTVIGVLSYQPTMDSVDYSDVLAITCTDGINTCTNSFRIPVAACVGPVLNVGPGQTYAHLDDAIAYMHSQGWGRPFAGVTLNVYPSTDPNYYLNDGQWYPISGNWPVPVTIQGAPGQTFPKFCGGGLYYAKGYFMGYNYDVWVKNVEICNVTDGYNGSSNDNLGGVVKESGCPTGNVFVDNCYIHDCQDGIARGHTNTKWFITNTRVSHCGVGETGYTHNVYVQGELAYFKNVLSDQSSVGHVLKTRAKSTILNNCRLYDGLTGHGSCDIDLPEGGVDTITNTVFHKGPNYQNPQAVHFADSGDSHCGWPSNQLTVSGCTFYGDAWLTGDQVAVRDVSMVGTGDGLAASITMTSNSFYGYTPSNYEITAANSGGGYGATSVTGSTTLTAQAAQDWSFPGPGPDPTVAHPPGPFLAPYGVVNGAQMTFPVNEIRLDSASSVGTSVVNPTFLPGQFSCPSPVWSLRKNPGNRYAINASTGAITTAAALIPGMVDVVEIQVHQDGVNFGQAFTAGGPTYYDHPADGSFIHSISIAASGNLPTMYTITPSAGAGGTISPSSAVQVAQGGSQTFTITANSGYTIGNILVDGTSVGAVSTYTFTNVQANHTISATFNTGPTYTITASAGVGGTISPNGAVQVGQGGSQTFTISANTNYTIANVTVDSTSVGAVSTYTFTNVQANHTIAATFNSTLGSVVSIFKSGAGINMAYVTNLDPLFQNAGASNVVQVSADNFEMCNNGNAYWNPNWANPTVAGSSDYAYLVKWDLSSIPTGSTVIKAQVRFYESSGNQGTVWIGPVTKSNWATGTVTPAGPNNPPQPTYTWTSTTGPFGIGDVSGLTAFSQPVAQPNVFDVTTNTQAMVNATAPNYGWAISATSNLTSAAGFVVGYATDTNSDTTLRPALFVCYIPADTTPPAAVTNLSVSNIAANSVQLNWTAPGDDGNTGTATTYDIRYSTSAITAGNFSSATQVTGVPAPQVAGTNQNVTVSGLSSNVTYYFAMKTADEVPNWSAISNVPSATTLDNTPPAAVTNLATSSPTTVAITLSWTAPSDPDSSCTAYDIRYSTSSITAGNFSSATQVSGAPAPASGGTNQNMTVTGLSPSTTYYFAMKTSDAAANWSAISNVPTGATVAPQTRTVGSGQTYSTVQAAHDAANDWDTISIVAGTYTQASGWANISKNHLTIVGTGATKPILDANGSCLSSKGIFNISGVSTTVQNLEFKNCRVASTYNSACIRLQAANLTVNNCYFHDSDYGIIADAATGSAVTVSGSEFYNNGYSGQSTCNIKIGVVDTFTLQNSYVHMAVGGDEVKSSALVSYILYNRITDETATDSYDLEFPSGGTAIVLGNMIQKSSSGNGTMIQYATGNPGTDLHVVNNTLVSNRSSVTGINNTSATSAQIQNNVFQGTSFTVASGANTQTSNWNTTNAYLQSASGYDYHLTASSTGAINAATAAGSVSGFSLTPVSEYAHPCTSTARLTNSTLDIGAYEYVRAFQYGLNSYTGVTDSYLSAGATTTNYGTSTKMSICGYSGANRMRPILKFDLSSIPTNTTITNATLYVYSYDQNGWRGSTGSYGVYPLTRAFNESQVTWNISASGVNWTTAGGDFNATADSTAAKQGSAGVWYAFNVTSRVQSMINTPSGNYGWIIKCTDESLSNQDYFTSSNNSDTIHRPRLCICGY